MSPHSEERSGPFTNDPRPPVTGIGRPSRADHNRGPASGRTVRTTDGQWRVYEVDSGPYDRRSGPSLIFESDGVLRRVRDYPAEWRELSDAELMEVSWRR